MKSLLYYMNKGKMYVLSSLDDVKCKICKEASNGQITADKVNSKGFRTV